MSIASKIGIDKAKPRVYLYRESFAHYSYIIVPLAKYGSLLDLYMNAIARRHTFSDSLKLYFFK